MTKVDIKQKVSAFIKQERLLEQGEHVFLALSGGGDSVALFRLLLQLQYTLDFKLSAGHFNHHLRGTYADRDEAFSKALAAKYEISFYVGHGNVTEYAKENGYSIEQAAREMRYAWLKKQADEIGASKIITAHHADDNIETVLLNFVRGSGTLGLSGIVPMRENICRPLLPVTRQEIEVYLSEIGQTYMQDETNEDTRFRRNKIRQDVLPILQEFNPNLGETVLRGATSLRQDASYLERMADAYLKPYLGAEILLDIWPLLQLDIAIRGRVYRQAAAYFQGNLSHTHIGQLEALVQNKSPSASISLPNGILARRQYDKLVIQKEVEQVSGVYPTVCLHEGENILPEWGLRVFLEAGKYEENENFMQNKKFYFQRLDICGKIMLGPRKTGDKVALYGRKGTKTVKKWMIELKIPAHKRNVLPIFYDEAGVIAIAEIGIAARVAPSENDVVYRLNWKEI